MDELPVTRDLSAALAKLDAQQVRNLINEALVSGISAEKILKTMQGGMIDVGKKYEAGEYFLSELMAAGDILKTAVEELTPHLGKVNVSIGSVVVGTVQGDLHDIGKNIFKTLVQSLGFTVHDLGADVPPEKFVDEARRTNADIVAMSALLTTTMDHMRLVIDALKKADLRSKSKIIIGGNPVTEQFGKEIGADEAVRDAVRGANRCKAWVIR